MTRPIGWRKEPARHALAAKGVPTRGLNVGRSITNIAFGTNAGEGMVKASAYDLETGRWRYVTAKPDDFTHLLLEVEVEDVAGPNMNRWKSIEVLVLKSEAGFDQIDDWLAKNVEEIAKTAWKADHAHIRVVGRVTAADIQRDTGLPKAEVISRTETVADEG